MSAIYTAYVQWKINAAAATKLLHTTLSLSDTELRLNLFFPDEAIFSQCLF